MEDSPLLKKNIQDEPGPIRVESFEGFKNLQQYESVQVIPQYRVSSNENEIGKDPYSQEFFARKKQFEEEVKVARLTGASKNTFASANSLEYSPSPKRQGQQDQISPINGSGVMINEKSAESICKQNSNPD